MGKPGFAKLLCIIAAFVVITATASSAQTFHEVDFDGTNGANPLYGPLLQGRDGNFYGTTSGGGSTSYCASGCGTAFKIAPDCDLTTIYNFCSELNAPMVRFPPAGLVQATNGNFCGTTFHGGNAMSDCLVQWHSV